jgi:hypothetical protein
MEVFSQYGAMYAELSESDVIEKKPVELGDGVLLPGEWVRKLGEKKRSSFSMSYGYYLRYAGMVDKTLLFGVNHSTAHPLYYAFHYIDSGYLAVMKWSWMWLGYSHQTFREIYRDQGCSRYT